MGATLWLSKAHGTTQRLLKALNGFERLLKGLKKASKAFNALKPYDLLALEGYEEIQREDIFKIKFKFDSGDSTPIELPTDSRGIVDRIDKDGTIWVSVSPPGPGPLLKARIFRQDFDKLLFYHIGGSNG